MKRILYVISLLLLLVTVIVACGDKGKVKVTEDEAEIQFDSLKYDFGLVPRDTSVSYEFVFHNIGATPLRLLQVATSCACTAVDFPQGSIEPGDQASITVVYNSRNRQPGHFNRSIVVRSNAKTSFLRLSISGDVAE